MDDRQNMMENGGQQENTENMENMAENTDMLIRQIHMILPKPVKISNRVINKFYI